MWSLFLILTCFAAVVKSEVEQLCAQVLEKFFLFVPDLDFEDDFQSKRMEHHD